MKKLAFILSLAALIYGGVTVRRSYRSVHGEIAAPMPWESTRAPELGQSPEAGSEDWPVGEPRSVDFGIDEASFAELTPREQRDQVRDWLLYTVGSYYVESVKELNERLFDVPISRQGYMQQIARFEYGVTRSCVLPDGSAVALIPEGSAAERSDHLSHVADVQRKDNGESPPLFHVFEYRLDLESEKAILTRRQSLSAERLFSGEFGYVEASIKTTAELAEFMKAVDDLVFVKVEEGSGSRSLRLGGRDLNRPYLNIRLEDVAALWQGEKKVQQDLERFEARWQREQVAFNELWQGKVDAFNEEWTQKFQRAAMSGSDPFSSLDSDIFSTPSFTTPKDDLLQARLRELLKDNDDPVLAESLRKLYGGTGFGLTLKQRHELAWQSLEAKQKQAFQELQQTYAREFKKSRLVQHTGFSLDPTYDYEGLARHLSSWDIPGMAQAAGVAEAYFEQIIAALKAEEPNALPFLQLIDQLKKSEGGPPFRSALYSRLEALNREYQFQAARYDGPLQGTEVGMVLFYTDLMAKIWSWDPSNPKAGGVEDFVVDTDHLISTVYRQELMELPGTRLWFGPKDEGFQLVSERRELLFARTATRLYAASSNDLNPGVEVAPNASSEASLSWWNDHYDDVARYEPEYQRLNEIMKWSLVVGWLAEDGDSDVLVFLEDEDVSRDAWFPDWGKAKTDLRFKDWESIGFHPRGYKGTTVETMPLLRSPMFAQFPDDYFPVWRITGGVSLGSKQLFKGRASLNSGLTRGLRRSNLAYDAIGDGSVLKTLRGARFEFGEVRAIARRVEGTSLRMTAPEASIVRNRWGDFSTRSFERSVARGNGRLAISSKAGDVPVGDLKIARSRNGFRVGWKSRAVERHRRLGKRLSKADNLEEALRLDPEVSEAFRLSEGENARYLVRSRRSERWVEYSLEQTPTRAVNEGWDARVGALERNAKNINMRWPEARAVDSALGGKPLRIKGGSPAGPAGKPPRKSPDFKAAANELSRDPSAFLARRRAGLEEGLGLADEAMRKGDGFEALDIIGDLKLRYGERPELLAREAIAKIGRGQAADAVELLNSKGLAKLSRREGFARGINEALTGQPRVARESTIRAGQRLEWRDLIVSKKKHPGIPGDGHPVTRLDGERIAMDYMIDRPPAQTFERVSDPIRGPPRSVYVQDSPALNNVDWSVKLSSGIDQTILSEFKVLRVPRADIHHFRPDAVLFEPGITVKLGGGGGGGGGGGSGIFGGGEFRRVGRSALGGRRAWSYSLYNADDDDDDDAAAADDDDDEEEEPPYVYFILKN